MIEKTVADSWLKFLADRFRVKIDPKEYYLSYSGGKDSHLLYWFIKEWLRDDDIVIVGTNTGFELPEIRNRIIKNCDVVLHPVMHRKELKEKFGIPCFSKQQDEYIYRYQHGSRTRNTMNAVMGKNTIFNLNSKARSLLLSDTLHPVSNKCCLYNKERPMIRWGKENHRKAIMGVRKSESATRKSKYNTCLKKNGDFTPLYDFSDELVDLIYKVYQIEVPECYNYLQRTGCAGCPYSRNTEIELSLIPEGQRRHAIKFFKESYDVLGIDYNNIQMTMYSVT